MSAAKATFYSLARRLQALCFGNADLGAACALIYTAAALTWIEYHWLPSAVQLRLLREVKGIRSDPSLGLMAASTWAIASIALFLIPSAWHAIRRGELQSIGWSARGFLRHSPVYLGLYALMLPAILWAAADERFLATYPFVKSARTDLQHFLRWEALYLLQFFALEAFFRGFLLFRLERATGALAPYIAALPYAMIHWHKPPLEAYGAIIAGIALGRLALKSRSFFGGVLLHGLVAFTMDWLAVRRAGLF